VISWPALTFKKRITMKIMTREELNEWFKTVTLVDMDTAFDGKTNKSSTCVYKSSEGKFYRMCFLNDIPDSRMVGLDSKDPIDLDTINDEYLPIEVTKEVEMIAKITWKPVP
jgi:hypothetical protein